MNIPWFHSVGGHLDIFWVGIIMCNATMNVLVHSYLLYTLSLGVYLGVEFLGHKCVCSVLVNTAK